MQILDTSAFIYSYHPDRPHASIPEVRDELEGAAQYRFDAMEGSGMRIEIPDTSSIEKIEKTAKEIGDREELSRTDIYVLAAAYQLKGTIVTDDYSIQNVAEKLDIEVLELEQEGIEEELDWKFQCTGCSRVYDEQKRCPVCGAETTRKKPG